MSFSDLEQHVFAYYVNGAADQLNMVGRYWPYGELVLIIEDKVQLSVRKFGPKAQMAAPKVARVFLDDMIARGAFSSEKSDLGGTMHQYQGPKYLARIEELRKTDPVIQKARAGGATYWDDTFAALRNQ